MKCNNWLQLSNWLSHFFARVRMESWLQINEIVEKLLASEDIQMEIFNRKVIEYTNYLKEQKAYEDGVAKATKKMNKKLKEQEIENNKKLKEKEIEIAKKMKEQNIDIEIIMKITGLNKEEIEKI